MKSRFSLFVAYALLATAGVLIASRPEAGGIGVTETASLTLLAMGAAALTMMTRVRRPR